MKKQYVVIGLGRFGTSVAKTLVDQGADVLVIDSSEEKVDQAINFATHAVQADATDEQALKSLGIRNFDGLDKGLSEICRVLVPGGHLVILELSTPDRFPMKQLFSVYSKVVIPLLGKCISKDNSAYTYLPQSIRAFPQGEIMQGVIRKAGFSEVRFRRLTFGICTLYIAKK